jgi:hypothetical protein
MSVSNAIRFAMGGLGGLLPVLASLVAVDLTAISTLIDSQGITEGLCVGYSIRVFGLFLLGGIMAALNSEVKSPIALVQIGIAAPALVTSYISGAALTKNQNQKTSYNIIFSQAYAADSYDRNRIVLAGNFWGDIINGIAPGLGVQLDNSYNDLERPPNHAANNAAGQTIGSKSHTILHPQISGTPFDICSGPLQTNNCSASGIMSAATQACIALGSPSAANYSIAGGYQGTALHWDGSIFKPLPSGAVFSSLDCTE